MLSEWNNYLSSNRPKLLGENTPSSASGWRGVIAGSHAMPRELRNGMTDANKGGTNAKGSAKKKKKPFVGDSIYRKELNNLTYDYNTKIAENLAQKLSANREFAEGDLAAKKARDLDIMKAYAMGGNAGAAGALGVTEPITNYYESFGVGGSKQLGLEELMNAIRKQNLLALQYKNMQRNNARDRYADRARLPGWTMNDGGKK